MRKTKVHCITLMVVDSDNLGEEGVISELENVSYPNDCLSPRVASIATKTVAWHDDHALNGPTWLDAFERMFGKLSR